MADTKTEPELEQEPKMSFGEHLEELRRRLIWSALAVTVAVTACMFWQDKLMAIAVRPHVRTMQALGQNTKLKAFGYPETFMIYMKVSFIVGLIAASPFVLWQMWRFIAAGLYPRERKYVMMFVPPSVLLFLGGATFGYFVLIPLSLRFLAGFGMEWGLVEQSIGLDNYLDLFFTMTVASGAIFEIPLVMSALSWIGLIPPAKFASWRRVEIIVAAILGAVLTPGGDLVSMISLMVPILVLYEIGILCGRLVSRPPAPEVSQA